jgi:hypothetical protein
MASGARVLAMRVTDMWASPALLTGTEGGDVTTSGPLAERGGRDGGSWQGHGRQTVASNTVARAVEQPELAGARYASDVDP